MNIQNDDPRNDYEAQIPEFMKWAQQRIAKEFKDNEAVANKFGTADVYSPFIKNASEK